MNTVQLPEHRQLFYGGAWHDPAEGGMVESFSPSTGESHGKVANGMQRDGQLAIAAAQAGFETWRAVAPLERAKLLREAAAVIREHGDELAMLDAADCGNPVAALKRDAATAVSRLEFFAGLVTEMKGDTIPMGSGRLNYTLREPLGVCTRIVAFNHPFQFCLSKMAAPLAAGNSVIVKPSEQAPLSGLRIAELIGHLFPPGVVNILTGGRELGETLSSHPGVASVSLVGSVPTGRAIMKAAADTLKAVSLELGGKNPLIAFPDADPEAVAAAAVSGMNFAWCGQSCGSLSRVFVHDSIHDEVLERIAAHVAKFKPGLPTDPETKMGALVSKAHLDRVQSYVRSGIEEGARLAYGGGEITDPALSRGNFMQPVILADVTANMRVAREEIFGPVQCIIRWSDEAQMLREVNDVEYGLTAAIYTGDLANAHRAAAAVEAGYVWVNENSRHFLGAPFGGYKQSGIGRDECLGELLAFTREKNIHIRFAD